MSNRKSITIMVMILSGIMTMNSCTHSSQVPEISFSKEIIPILTTYCTINSSCHLGANGANQQVNLDSAVAYNTLFAKNLISINDPSSSLLYVEMQSNEMPKPPAAPVPASQQLLVLEWIQQGARNN